jgi:hypothetical protein
MKLEREEGAQLQLSTHDGKRTFDMEVLDDLVLTEGTRLFKSALFLRHGADADDFRSYASDNQARITASDDMAIFWLRFLGCEFIVEPRIATQRFYESAITFINETLTNPVQKDEVFEHLQSQMKSPQRNFSPVSFIDHYVPAPLRAEFKVHLRETNAINTFTKDVADISNRLRTSSYITAHGVRVSVRADNAERVNVGPDTIIVNDLLVSINRK